MLTKQEVFEKMARHLLAQGEKSTVYDSGSPEELPRCAYRGDNGRTCAAGCLIDDEHYSPHIEGMGARHRDVQVRLVRSGVDMGDPETCTLVRNGQIIHDAYDPKVWRERLKALAVREACEWPVGL